MVQKKLSGKGGLTIPQQMRHELGMLGGTAVELIPTGDGSLLIRKHCPICHECGSIEDVKGLGHIGLCRACFEALREEFDGYANYER